MTNTDALHNSITEAISKLASALKGGQTEELRDYLSAMARFHRYSLYNQILIWIQCPTAAQVAGYSTWQTFGRQVKKGESAIRILAPLTQKDPETKEQKLIGFKPVCVFDLSQTDGPDLPKKPKPYSMDGFSQAQAQALAAKSTFPVEYVDAPLYHFGSTNGKRIKINQNLSPADQAGTLLHEWAHALLHFGSGPGCTLTSQEKELEAESVAFVLCEMLGIKALEASSNYLVHYGADEKALAASLKHIAQAVKEIASVLDITNPVEPTAPYIPQHQPEQQGVQL